MEKAKILLVEDERKIVDLLRLYLEREGYAVSSAADGEEALKSFARLRPSLVILDLMLPLLDGLEVCRRIRQDSQVPILMLTAKDEEADKVIGLSIGADDYVTKPFSPREMVARVKALLRRSRLSVGEGDQELSDAGLKLIPDKRQAFKGEDEITLTALEFDLLACLMKSPGRVYTRDQLLANVWGADYIGDPRVVDVHVGNLRRKVEDDSSLPRRIKTVRDVGYKFDPQG
jgi:two-component system alkaline phosphatase synthesis response regulator PhoP